MVDDAPGVYMDHASATPLDPRVRDAICATLAADPADPEALHEAARPAAAMLDAARVEVAALIGADPEGIVFTAGDTEARNLLVKGIWSANRHRGDHIVTTTVEHDGVAHACRTLERAGAHVTRVAVDGWGRVDPGDLADAVRDDTVLVSIPHAQPEIGAVNDVAALCAAVRRRSDAAIHVDAGATAGLLPIDVNGWGCDALSLGGGSMAGPRWVGAAWTRPGTRLHPLIEGGAQEGGKRAGHHDIAGIVGLGAAARIAREEGPARAAAMRAAAADLIATVSAIDGVHLNGPPPEDRIPGHVQVGVEGVEGEALTLLLSAAGIACSPGSSCTAAGKSSAVLEAIGQRPPRSLSAVLFTLGPQTGRDDIECAARALATAVERLRAMGVRG